MTILQSTHVSYVQQLHAIQYAILHSAAFHPKMLAVSRILAVFLFIAIIRLSRKSAAISFQPAVI